MSSSTKELSTSDRPSLAIYDDPDHEPPVGTAEHALWLVHWHIAYEDEARIDKLGELYADDIVWEMHFPFETPAFQGKDAVLANYRGLMSVIPDLGGPVLSRYSTPAHAFIDQWVSYTTTIPEGVPRQGLLASDMLPEGRLMTGRLLHDFKIRDGLIARETAFFVPEAVK